MKIIKEILDYLIKNNKTISFAESITGGGLSYYFIKNKGASKVLKESFVVYSNDSKIKTLNLKKETIDTYSVVSKEVASEMVEGLWKKTSANLSVAITGNASGDSKILESHLGIIYNGSKFLYHLRYKNKKRERVLKSLIKRVYQEIFKILDIK